MSLLEHVSPIEWDNVILYGQYVLDRARSADRDLRAYFCSNLGGTLRAVGLEVVEDHHVPGAEFRCQHLIDIGLERLRVSGTGEDQRRPHTI